MRGLGGRAGAPGRIASKAMPAARATSWRTSSETAREAQSSPPSRSWGNGTPDLRPDYAADYFAAFVLDPDGNNIEAVVHEAKRATRPVYYIGTYDIDDPELFQQYPPRVLALLPKYGGEVLASDTSGHLVEGSRRTMNAIIRFPSKEAALGLYGDPAYQEAQRIRQKSTSNTSMVLVDEFALPA